MIMTVDELITKLLISYDIDETVVATMYSIEDVESFDLAEEIDNQDVWETVSRQLEGALQYSQEELNEALSQYIQDYVELGIVRKASEVKE